MSTIQDFQGLSNAISYTKEAEAFKDELASFICRKRHLDPKVYANSHTEIKVTSKGDLVVSLWSYHKEEPLSFDKYNTEIEEYVPRRDYYIWEFTMLVQQSELAEFIVDARIRHGKMFR